MGKKIFLFVFFILLFSLNAHAAKYKIIFTEGEYIFDNNLPHEDLGNKYLAKVQLYKDGKLVLDGIRGSTLSDSIFYYQMQHDGVQGMSITDKNIQDIFASWDSQLDGVSKDKKIDEFLQNNNEIICHIASVPVLWSGRYKFVIGLHKSGNSVYGQPYVPRLLGTWDKKYPYNATSGDSTDDTLSALNGVWLATINKNKRHSMKRIASGINIHDGRRGKDDRDSGGCLTIHPDDWNKFIKELPDIESWGSDNHTGEVIIIRKEKVAVKSPPKPQSAILNELKGFIGIESGNE